MGCDILCCGDFNFELCINKSRETLAKAIMNSHSYKPPPQAADSPALATVPSTLGRKPSRRVAARSIAVCFEALEQRRFFSVASLPNIPVTTDPGVQQQPSLVVDPLDSRHVVIAYMDHSLVQIGYAGVGIADSRDGGKTWAQSSIPLPGGFDQGAANPMAKFDEEGHLFVSFSAVTFLGPKAPLSDPNGGDPNTGALYRTYGLTSTNGIFIARSDDGGATFSPAVAISSNVYDGKTKVPFDIKPDIAIDTFQTLPDGQANPHFGSIYAIWSRFYPAGEFPGESSSPGNNGSSGGSALQIAVSTDGGKSFSLRLPEPTKKHPHPAPVSVIHDSYYTGIGPGEGLGAANWGHLAVGPEGDVYAAYYDFGAFEVVHSTDAAQSFTVADQNAHPPKLTVFDPSNGTADTAAPDHLFRTQAVRNIVVDPNQPGTIYVAEGITGQDAQGTELDSGDIYFARSTDYGGTWDTSFKVAGRKSNALNDDNQGKQATGAAEDLLGRQFFAKLAIDSNGNLAAIWDDTRRDPANKQIDVFGTVSTDGGQNFTPDFRITNTTFDAANGAFTTPAGDTNYLGDFSGLAIADGNVYAAWTDTRTGNQDIFFATYPLTATPSAPNDRFEPNDDSPGATDLGIIGIPRHLPKLAIVADDVDVYQFSALATGTIKIDVNQVRRGLRLEAELLDDSGANLLASATNVLDANGTVIGKQIRFPSVANHLYTLRITSHDDRSTEYSLDLQALTENLGAPVHRNIAGSLTPGDQEYYLVTAAASGSLSVRLAVGDGFAGDLRIRLEDADTQEPFASGSQSATIPVNKGQRVLIRVSASRRLQRHRFVRVQTEQSRHIQRRQRQAGSISRGQWSIAGGDGRCEQ